MSWPMPTGQWDSANAGVPVNMAQGTNMGAFTQDQWSSMQQQNWHQWAQWQQQYAQWQSQYGDKYGVQMQAMHTMGAVPPLPMNSAVPPPAPPPPDNPPPPPPPHENNQPLYETTPTPVQPPKTQQNYHYNTNTTGNNQSWQSHQNSTETTQPSHGVNSEALKKLAEEEKLFDIQFQKWEEEIEKWRRENVNHPDKEAYKEYESKFEACRAQLLERRQQMNQKKARLMGNSQQQSTQSNTSSNAAYGPGKTANATNFVQNRQPQNCNNKPVQNKHSIQTDYQQYPQTGFINRRNNINIEPQDRYESYGSVELDPVPKTSFLPGVNSGRGIPGLDLVLFEAEKMQKANSQQGVIVIPEEDEPSSSASTHPPDYSKISKGINNILGDEKIMNILNMVRGHGIPENVNNQQGQQSGLQQHQQQPGFQQQHPGQLPHENQQQFNKYADNQYNNMNQYNDPIPNQGDKNRQNFNNRLEPNYQNQSNHFDLHNQNQSQFNQQNNRMNNFKQGPKINQENFNRNNDFGDQNTMGNVRPGPPMRQNVGPRPLMEISTSLLARPNDFQRGPQGNQNIQMMNEPPPIQPHKPKWVDEPLFTPSIIVEYEHKPLRLKARDFIEPVHTFDYNHMSKDGDKKKPFEIEDDYFVRLPRREPRDYEDSRYPPPSYARDAYSRDHYERRVPREDYPPRVPPLEYDDRRRDERHDDRRREDRYRVRDDFYRDKSDRSRPDIDRIRMDVERGKMGHDSGRLDCDRGRMDSDRGRTEYDRDPYRSRDKENRREDSRRHSRSRERDRIRDLDIRKRGHSRESEVSDKSKKSKDTDRSSNTKAHIIMIDDIIEAPGREMRPEKIVIVLRGLPGSGKSYLAKLIRDREAEYGGTARIMSIDDYFMQEGEVEEIDPSTGKTVKKATLKYEYDEKSEEAYINSLKRALKRTITDGFFSFLIFDAVNDQLKSYADIWNFARQNGFQVYICTLDLDIKSCFRRNIHNRTLQEIEIISSRFFPTPKHHIQLDPTTLLQSAAITDVQMEDATDEVVMEDVQESEVESSFTSKWEKMDDATQLARLDGTNRPLRPSQLSMEDYLQLDDWQPTKAKPGKKTVRWADLEERRKQEKMRAIGFVVGQTDWDRMTDPTMGSSALTQTKYIARVNKRS